MDEYFQALSNLVALTGFISTSFTSVTALSPLGLSSDVTTTVRSNLRSFNKQVVPLLEHLFQDTKAAVEERIIKEIYPEFVKHQLIQCVKSSFSVSRSLVQDFKTAYPGLGDSFVLTDPLDRDNPILFASDGFCDITGYSRPEILNQNCRFLQGLSPDRTAGQRIKEAVSLGRETTQLILNYRKDGPAFWNLVFICPLQEQGRSRYCLGAQINVSDTIGPHYKDILRVLHFGDVPGESAGETTTNPQRVERSPGLRVRDDRKRNPQRSRFFKPFSRRSTGPPETRCDSPDIFGYADGELPKTPGSGVSVTSQITLLDDLNCPYPDILVMRYVPAIARSPQPEGRSSHPAPRMPVAFCSAGAWVLLGLEQCDKEMILDQDIFSVLVDQGISPTITKTLQSNIQHSLAAGESVSTDLLLSAEVPSKLLGRRSKKGSIMSLSNRSRDNTSSATESDSSLARRKSETLERGAELFSNAIFGSKMRKVITQWTPLKDVGGAVAWVVLVMTPSSSGGG